MTELITIAVSTPLIGLFAGYCSGMADSTMYDERAEQRANLHQRALLHTIERSGYTEVGAENNIFRSSVEKDNDDNLSYGIIHHYASNDSSFIDVRINPNAFTRYHIGNPNDAWHWIRRAERYGGYVTALVSGALIGMSWWLLAMVVCHSIAGLIGSNLGDKWKGSMWMRKLGEWINGK